MVYDATLFVTQKAGRAAVTAVLQKEPTKRQRAGQACAVAVRHAAGAISVAGAAAGVAVLDLAAKGGDGDVKAAVEVARCAVLAMGGSGMEAEAAQASIEALHIDGDVTKTVANAVKAKGGFSTVASAAVAAVAEAQGKSQEEIKAASEAAIKVCVRACVGAACWTRLRWVAARSRRLTYAS